MIFILETVLLITCQGSKTPIQQRVNQKEMIDSLYVKDYILHMLFSHFFLHRCLLIFAFHFFGADFKSFFNCQVWEDLSLCIKLNKPTATVNTYSSQTYTIWMSVSILLYAYFSISLSFVSLFHWQPQMNINE